MAEGVDVDNHCGDCCGGRCIFCDSERAQRNIDDDLRERASKRLAAYVARSVDPAATYARAGDGYGDRIHYADCSVVGTLAWAPILMSRSEVIALRSRRAAPLCQICKPDLPALPSPLMRKLNRYGRINSGTGWPL